MTDRRQLVAVALITSAIAVASLAAQQTAGAPGSAAVAQQPAAGRGGGRAPAPLVPHEDYTGFTKLWDGATFTNWNGESDVWTIANGALHADTTKTPGQHHLHYVGPGAVMRDFDLKVEVKLSAAGANGGVQYRSRLLHASHGGSIDNPLGTSLPAGITTFAQAVTAGLATEPPPRGGRADNANAAAANAGRNTATAGAAGAGSAAGPGAGGRGPTGPNGPTNEPNPWQVSGYQFDLDSNNRYTGQLYEGQGRGIVTPPGSIVELLAARTVARIGIMTDRPSSWVKPHMGGDGEWNQLEIIARGNTLLHMINGKLMSVTIDDDPVFRAYQGILSLQLEGNGQIWYRNIYVKQLDKPLEIPK